VRTPLNAIVNCLEIALEGTLEPEIRENLMRSHSASKTLIYVINDLLDLTRTEEGHDLIKNELFDPRQVLHQVTDVFKADTLCKELSMEVIEYDGLPPLVRGDSARLRRVVTNVIANAVEHTTTGGLKIEIWSNGITDGKYNIEIAVEDTGEGISQSKMDTLFREFEQIRAEEELETGNLEGAQGENASFNTLRKIPSQTVLGLGLAIVAHSIQNMNGQLRLKSDEGKGTRFTICIPFELSQEVDGAASHGGSTATPLPIEGEVTLLQPFGKSLTRHSFQEFHISSSPGRIVLASPESDRVDEANRVGGVDWVDGHDGETSSPPSLLSPATEYFSAIPDSATTPPIRSSPTLVREGDGEEPVPCPSQSVPSGPVVCETPPLTLAAPPPSASTQKFTVLVAEDDRINCMVMKKQLETLGHDVSFTVNGAECVRRFEQNGTRYDAILMDLQVTASPPHS
jgi:CheY-like chemotaxis protein